MTQQLAGVDTGGTFTDFVLVRDGALHVHKVLSTPDNPAGAIIRGFQDLDAVGVIDVVVHGSTVATNAVLERKGARVGLIATAGFRDVLEIGRQARPKIYDLHPRTIPPLVPRDRRVEVIERVDERGAVLVPLDETSVDGAIAALAAMNVEAVAICLLFSFTNPEHERQVAERARRAGLHVSVSHEVLPEFREFERTSTVVLNAYVGPLMDRYLERLEADLPAGTRLRIMQSNGGSISATTARREAARTLLSGPAAGVVGAAAVARASGFAQTITFDMGGTSTDVALVDGVATETTDGAIGGYPSKLPMIAIHTVGAGGGSIAWFDSGGALRVGPRSAGAAPGPAAYGRGGNEPTVTDANVVLGRLRPDAFLGGTMPLDVEAARRAVESVAAGLRAPIEEAALGIVRIANANMEAAIRVISVECGYDPRRFTLVAFGGAGPLHACDLAAALRIPRVLVPATPGVLSALGMLIADVRKDYVRTVMLPATEAQEQIDLVLAELFGLARSDLLDEAVSPDCIELEQFVDLRYVGQSYELTVPYYGDLGQTVANFHTTHEQRFGYSDPGERVDLVNVRVTARGLTEPPPLRRMTAVPGATPKPTGETTVVFAGAKGVETHATRVFDREALPPGTRLSGPAIITQYDTTTVLPPGWQASVDHFGSLIAEPFDEGYRR